MTAASDNMTMPMLDSKSISDNKTMSMPMKMPMMSMPMDMPMSMPKKTTDVSHEHCHTSECDREHNHDHASEYVQCLKGV
jgi:hypothetical protein